MIINQRTIQRIGKSLYTYSESEKSEPNQQFLKSVQQSKIKKHGLHIGKILAYVESQNFRTHFEVKKYIHAHAWSCLHSWMLDYRSRFLNCSWGQIHHCMIFRQQLKFQMRKFNYIQMGSYSDRRDRNIYHELKRIQNVIYFSLDDLFVYDFKAKTLSQIICQDMGLYLGNSELTEVEEANVHKIQQYIQAKMQQLKVTNLKTIKEGKFEWKL